MTDDPRLLQTDEDALMALEMPEHTPDAPLETEISLKRGLRITSMAISQEAEVALTKADEFAHQATAVVKRGFGTFGKHLGRWLGVNGQPGA